LASDNSVAAEGTLTFVPIVADGSEPTKRYSYVHSFGVANAKLLTDRDLASAVDAYQTKVIAAAKKYGYMGNVSCRIGSQSVTGSVNTLEVFIFVPVSLPREIFERALTASNLKVFVDAAVMALPSPVLNGYSAVNSITPKLDAIPDHCFDSVQNEDETDVDCGGSCSTCPTLSKCSVNMDCLSTQCNSSICEAANSALSFSGTVAMTIMAVSTALAFFM